MGDDAFELVEVGAAYDRHQGPAIDIAQRRVQGKIGMQERNLAAGQHGVQGEIAFALVDQFLQFLAG